MYWFSMQGGLQGLGAMKGNDIMKKNAPIAARVKKQGRYFWTILVGQREFERAVKRIRDGVAYNTSMSLHEIATEHSWDHQQIHLDSGCKIDIFAEWHDERQHNVVNVWSDTGAVQMAEDVVIQPFLDEGGKFAIGGE